MSQHAATDRPWTPTAFEKAVVSPSGIHYDRVMAEQSLLVVQDQDGFVAGEVFPNKDVMSPSDVFASYDRSYFLRHNVSQVAPDGVPKTVTWGMDFDKRYDVKVYKTRCMLPKELIARQVPPVDLENEAVKLLTQHGLIFKDEMWCANFFAANIWDTDLIGDATPNGAELLHWSDDDSLPIFNVQDAQTAFRRSVGKEAEIGLIGREAHDALLKNPQLLSRIINNSGNAGSNQPVRPTTETIRNAFGLKKLVVANAIHDTGAEGAALAPEFIAGKHFWMGHVPDSVGVLTPIPGQTFSWKGYNPGMNNLGFGFRRYFVEERETWYIEMTLAFDMKVVAPYLGKLFRGIVA
jgi:hypothetical protein